MEWDPLMSSLMQSVLVGAAVCAAAAFVLWRVVAPWFTGAKPGCASCASGNPCSDKPSSQLPADVHPLVIVRPKSG
jgi:hypothetical protein